MTDSLFSGAVVVRARGAACRRDLNPESLTELQGCAVEPGVAALEPGARMQFERTGYFSTDKESTSEALVFNRIVTLRDSWAKIAPKK